MRLRRAIFGVSDLMVAHTAFIVHVVCSILMETRPVQIYLPTDHVVRLSGWLPLLTLLTFIRAAGLRPNDDINYS